jgi:putative glycosyltransferase (TIGR04348 family)
MSVKVVLVSPATQEANNGNWHTAHRWSQFLSQGLNHCDTAIMTQWSGEPQTSAKQPADLMIALHARRSAESIAAWATACPTRPLILVLTGTDLYRDIQHDPLAQQSLALATHIVVLQEAALAVLPQAHRAKTRVIYQSAPRLKTAVKSTHRFVALMVGHLRDEKDPLTFMKAARDTASATIHFEQIGMALELKFEQAALEAAQLNPAYHWLGGLPRAATRQRIKRAHVLVSCSKMEGGAHVILEAVQSGTPVLASRIDGNVGMLGQHYSGYFELGDAAQLSILVQRCALEPDFLALLQSQCGQRAQLFEPALEKRLVLNLVTSALAAHENIRKPP